MQLLDGEEFDSVSFAKGNTYSIEELIEVSGMKLYYTNTKEKNPYIIFEKNDFAIDEMIDEFSSIVDQIQKKNFASRTKNTSICADCDMRYYCNRIKR